MPQQLRKALSEGRTMPLEQAVAYALADEAPHAPGDTPNDQITARNSQFHDWGEVPEIANVYGRQAELAQLERWLVQDRCRLIDVLGMGGVGKTTLAAAAVKAVAAQF